MSLGSLFRKFNCDKGTKHGYQEVYSKELDHLKNKPINFLEVGIFKGTSTEAFLEYFPNAKFYGIDIFTRLQPEDVKVLNHERVKWIKGDSMSYGIQSQIKKEWGNTKFDVIIDDAKHTPEANAITFRNISPFLKTKGIYFVEDVFPFHKMTVKEMSHHWIQSHSKELNHLKFQKFENAIKDYNTEEFDLRSKSKQPESYIFKIMNK